MPSQGCGPFFPDTVLDEPQAALNIPPVSYLHDLYRLAGKPFPLGESRPESSPKPFLRQIPHEAAELREFWQKAGVASDEIERRIRHYEDVRRQLLSPIVDAGGMVFPTHGDQPVSLAARPLGAEFPADVADYVEAARLHASSQTPEARTLWKSILDRPAGERRLRSAWAAWMLAKTSPNETECLGWYEQVETEIQAGAADAIGLRGAAKGWRAAKLGNPLIAMHFYYDAFVGGKESAAIDLRNLSSKLLHAGNADVFISAAADPLIRRLINLDLHASLDGPRQMPLESPPPGERQMPPVEWLTALESHATGPLDDGARVAWALYSSGRYAEARKWLSLSATNDPLGVWLQAKFDLRDGKLDEANQHLAEALRHRSKPSTWDPANPVDELRWFENATEIEGASQSRLLADAGIVALAREEYLAALESLRKGGFREDAAYLAECLISTDGLIRHVRKVAPAWRAVASEERENFPPLDPFTCLQTGANFSPAGIGTDNQLRYLLARRLAREKRLKEACEFMPPELLPVMEHYAALDRVRKSGRFSGEARAAVIWRQALIHRHLGAELFSTDGAPDGGARGWNFPTLQFSTIRAMKDGWSHRWSREPHYGPPEKPEDHAIPQVTADEISRTRRFSVRSTQRFHYRYAAADLAWEASRALPPNHPLLPRLYNTAGLWLASNDPQAADRFYQAMVRRCAKTPEGQSADAKRWFLADLPSLGDLPTLPREFQKTPAEKPRP